MEEIKDILMNMVDEAEEGGISSLELLGKLRGLEKFTKECASQIEYAATNEFDLECEGGKTIKNHKGFEVTKRSGGWSWNFKGVKEHSDLEAKKKGLEERYKALFEHQDCIDAESGEVLDIQRKPRADSYSFKTSKQPS